MNRNRVVQAGDDAATVDGTVLLEAARVASDWLAAHRDAINALNVFPVPDGDTGTNMLLTLRAAVSEGEQAARTDSGAGAIATAIARGAFFGARGNSGVILCQMLRGFAATFADQPTIGGRDFAAALAGARDQAYKAVLEPVEGTMLTVVRVAAEHAEAAVRAAPDASPELPIVLAAAFAGAQEALATTPELLDILRAANVVDAGGQGVVHILEGLKRFAHGEVDAPLPTAPLAPQFWGEHEGAATAALGSAMPFLDQVGHLHGDDAFGYCVNFIVLGTDIDVTEARTRLAALGTSAEVFGDGNALRVHLHTENPGPVLDYAVGLGALDQIEIENIEIQTQALVRQRAAAKPTRAGATIPKSPIAVVAVVLGSGLTDAMRAMGADAVVSGGQTMNPSTAELVAGINSLPHDQIILLPNNPNILMTAQQATKLTDKQVHVVPSRSVPQGLAALAALSFEAAFEDNIRRMTRALDQVQTIEVTRAVRDATIEGTTIGSGQIIGFLDDRLVAAGQQLAAVAAKAVAAAELDQAELVTIITGEDANPGDTEQLRATIAAAHPELTVELCDGGQPHYPFVISIE